MSQTTFNKTELRHRFLLAWKKSKKHNDERVNAEIVWDILIQHYSNSARHYHDFNHIIHCCTEMYRAKDHIDSLQTILMAILFHDVICEPYADDNEIKSADMFEKIHQSSFDGVFIQQVKQLILSTIYSYIPVGNDEKIISDIDLSSFALPWELFVKDSHAVRAEFVNQQDSIYYKNKLKFLNGLLGRPQIYLSEFFYQRCETKARTNILQYIELLRDQGHI